MRYVTLAGDDSLRNDRAQRTAPNHASRYYSVRVRDPSLTAAAAVPFLDLTLKREKEVKPAMSPKLRSSLQGSSGPA